MTFIQQTIMIPALKLPGLVTLFQTKLSKTIIKTASTKFNLLVNRTKKIISMMLH